MLKKTSLLSVSNGLQQCYACQPVLGCSSANSSTSSSHLPIPRARPTTWTTNKRRRTTEPINKHTRRYYATVRGDGLDFRDNMNWPCKKNLGADKFTPSPYEIFDMHRSSVYSKQKFYELVKIYHPDRSNHVTDCEITQYERLERYRLVVLAHEILSDPHKRSAYDAYGAGWGAKQRPVPAQHSRGFSSSTGKYYGRGAEYDSTPFSNATWEDWERWYRRDAPQSARQQYTGTYLNPNAFAALVVALAVVSGVVSATRAGQYSASLGEKQLAFTEETNRFMTERANNLVDNRLDKNARVKHFLEKRDPTRYGLKEEEEIEYRRHFGGTNGLPPDRSVTGTKLASKKPTQTDND